MGIICKKCGAENDNGAGYCKNCGTKVSKGQEKTGNAIWYVVIVLALAIMVTMVILNTSNNSQEQQQQLPQNQAISVPTPKPTTCEWVNIPIYEQRPYPVYIDVPTKLKYEVVDQRGEPFLNGLNWWVRYIVSVRNIDSESGSFTLRMSLITESGASKAIKTYPEQTITKILVPGETGNFKIEYDVDIGEQFVSGQKTIEPSTKIVPTPTTEWRNEIVGYRPEKQCTGG